MAFSATVRQLLISCPGDIPDRDLTVLRKQIQRWNFMYGKDRQTVVVPVSWSVNAVAELGISIQGVLDAQIVDDSDCCIALFANKLGTPTMGAPSGTAYEINRLATRGRYVAVLRSRRKIDTTSLDISEMQLLQAYLDEIKPLAMIAEYRDDAELADQVNSVLAHLARTEWIQPDQTSPHSPRAEEAATVSARVQGSERLAFGPHGAEAARDWVLILRNDGKTPARNIGVVIEPDSTDGPPWLILGAGADADDIGELAPSEEARFRVVPVDGDVRKVRCIVRWVDGRGDQEATCILQLA